MADDPVRMLDALIAEKVTNRYGSTYGLKLRDTVAGRAMLALGRDAQAAIVTDGVRRIRDAEREYRRLAEAADGEHWCREDMPWHARWLDRCYMEVAVRDLLRKRLPLGETALIELLDWPSNSETRVGSFYFPLAGIVAAAEARAADGTLSPPLRQSVERLSAVLRANDRDKDNRKYADRLAALIDAGPQVRIEPGEAWSDAARADLAAMPDSTRSAWTALLAHCQAASGGKPTAKWLKEAGRPRAAVGDGEFRGRVLRWFPLVDKPRTDRGEPQPQYGPGYYYEVNAGNADLLKGLAWCCGSFEDRELARAVTALALSAYRKLPGHGPRLVSLGNACVWALGAMPGADAVGQLALLKVKVKFGTAQKEVEKALTATAERIGLPREEVEELGVPSYGLEEVGVRREAFGDYAAELRVSGSDAALHWSKAGKPLKSVPAAAKAEYAEDVKEVQAALKDVQKMLPAQRERIDALFLQRKTWPVEAWRERYLDHPLVGTVARRLVWTFDGRPAIWHDGRMVDADGNDVSPAGPVALWHPIGEPVEAVLAWRAWLESHEVRQPFKQAHREVYLLTDAERATRVYSNRFAAHVLRQHQFSALAAARGWKNKLRLLVDDTYPPASRELAAWGLRAEFWVEGIGDDFGRDTNESGTFLRLATDQVRFYPLGAAQRFAHAGGGYHPAWNRHAADEPLPLDQVPPLVFSEILRDVDLFVGVASVGNDPTWADGGPDGQFRDYWHSYSFGDLSGTAATRKSTLERLIPRLKIAPRCSFTDRFLVVKGSLRTYKIHLGSGNILMEPNDQYLCIVPKQSGSAGEGVFLPFEGDGTLAVILSKAFLLADDAKIKDPTITSQIALRA